MATANDAKNLTNQYGDATHFYGNGVNSTRGQNNNIFYYHRQGIKQATTNPIFSQFASSYDMMRNTGKEFRVSVEWRAYDRLPYTDDTWNERSGHKFTDAFYKDGFMANRDIADVENSLYGESGKGTIGNIGTNGYRLVEGQLTGNKVSIKTTTYSATLERFGAMIDFTDESLLFDEKMTLSYYHSYLGELVGQLREDAIQLGMLSSSNIMYAGSATSMRTLGAGIGTGAVDTTTKRNAVEESYKINYALVQKLVSRLINFRCPKHKSILTGSVKIGTTPINEAYVAIVGNQVRVDLENTTRGPTIYGEDFALKSVETYAASGPLMKGEIGSMNQVRFVATEQMMKFAGAGAEVDTNYVGNLSRTTMADGKTYFDVFPIIVPGADSYATIGLQGHNQIQWKSKAPGTVDTVDQYGAYGFFSASFYFAGIIKRPERLPVIYVLASA